MDQKTFEIVAGVIFAIVALVHLFRLAEGWDIIVGTWTVPLWLSWAGLIIPGVLAYYGLKLGSHHERPSRLI